MLFRSNKIKLSKGTKINRDDLIKKLIEIGYKRESMVYDTSDFSVRGFVVDVYPINEENPIRIEFFDDEIEKIKHFEVVTQKSVDELDTIEIQSIKDDFGDNTSSIREYIEDGKVIFSNYNQLINQEKMIQPQLKYLEIENSVYKVKDLTKKEDIFLDTINNKNCDIDIEAKSKIGRAHV